MHAGLIRLCAPNAPAATDWCVCRPFATHLAGSEASICSVAARLWLCEGLRMLSQVSTSWPSISSLLSNCSCIGAPLPTHIGFDTSCRIRSAASASRTTQRRPASSARRRTMWMPSVASAPAGESLHLPCKHTTKACYASRHWQSAPLLWGCADCVSQDSLPHPGWLPHVAAQLRLRMPDPRITGIKVTSSRRWRGA